MSNRRAVRNAAIALALTVWMLGPTGAESKSDLVGTIETFAGGPRTGPALDLGHQARGVAAEGGIVYITDELNSVVRALDTTTGIQTPVIGLGSLGFSGDGGPAIDAQVDLEPGGRVAVRDGVIYVADAGNQRIRRIGTDGVVETIAGTGEKGYSGDGGPATEATFHDAVGLTADAYGNVYVADQRNHVVRKIDTTGIVTTVAGTGHPGFSGDGGPATGAQLSYPLTVDIGPNGNLLITDTYNHRIRVVDTQGVIHTYAGNGITLAGQPVSGGDGGPATEASFNLPMDAQADGDGNVYVADFGGNRVRKIDSEGTITTVAGNGAPAFTGDGGPATLASVQGTTSVTPADDGSLYLVDFVSKRIRRVSPAGVITTVSGNGTTGLSGDGGPAAQGQLNGAYATDIDANGSVYIADLGNDVVRKVDASGVITTIAGNGVRGYGGDGGPATSASLNLPFGVAAAPDGSVYVADTFNHRIRRVLPDGRIVTAAGTGVAGFAGDSGPAVAGMFSGIVGIDVDQYGNLYIADSGNNRIRLLTPNGLLWTVVGTGWASSDGDGGPALSAAINRPVDVDVTADGTLYIVEQGGQRVRKVDLDPTTFMGTISTVAGSGPPVAGVDCFDPRLQDRPAAPTGDGGPAVSAQLNCPTGVAADAVGNVFIADFFSSRLRRVDADGVISTIAGSEEWGLTGDGGLATHAQIYGPTDVTVTRSGDLVFPDHGNNRVRAIDFLRADRDAAHDGWPIW